jgi:hypothetical protein
MPVAGSPVFASWSLTPLIPGSLKRLTDSSGLLVSRGLAEQLHEANKES